MMSKDLLIDYSERVFILLLVAPFMIAISRSLPENPYSILVAFSEALVVLFILIRKPGAISTRPYPLAVALLGTALPLLVRPADLAFVPATVSGGIMSLGLIINISSKLALNRSFGLVAANRGIKRGGPYRFVRHPMYLGYFVTQIGFLLSSFSLTNLAIYSAAWFFQILRIIEEEKFLSQDPDYRAFMEQVPRRVLPGF